MCSQGWLLQVRLDIQKSTEGHPQKEMPMCYCHRLPTAEHRVPTLYGASPLPISSKRPFFEASCARETSGGDGLSLSRLCIVYMYDSSLFVTIHSYCLYGPILYFSHHIHHSSHVLFYMFVPVHAFGLCRAINKINKITRHHPQSIKVDLPTPTTS